MKCNKKLEKAVIDQKKASAKLKYRK